MPARIEDPSDPEYYYCVEYIPDLSLVRMSEEEAGLYITEAAFSEKMIHPTPRELAAQVLGLLARNNECVSKPIAATAAFIYKHEALSGIKSPVDSIIIGQMLHPKRDQPMDTLALYNAYCERIGYEPDKFDVRHINDTMRKATELYAPWRPWIYNEHERLMRPPPPPMELES